MRRFNPEKELKKIQYGNRNKAIFSKKRLYRRTYKRSNGKNRRIEK